MANGGPTTQQLFLQLTMAANVLNQEDRQVQLNHRQEEKEIKKAEKRNQKAIVRHQQIDMQRQKVIKAQKPYNYGKSSTHIGKPGQ